MNCSMMWSWSDHNITPWSLSMMWTWVTIMEWYIMEWYIMGHFMKLSWSDANIASWSHHGTSWHHSMIWISITPWSHHGDLLHGVNKDLSMIASWNITPWWHGDIIEQYIMEQSMMWSWSNGHRSLHKNIDPRCEHRSLYDHIIKHCSLVISWHKWQ